MDLNYITITPRSDGKYNIISTFSDGSGTEYTKRSTAIAANSVAPVIEGLLGTTVTASISEKTTAASLEEAKS